MGWPNAPGAQYGFPAPTPEQELAILRSQAKEMEEALRETQNRMRELEEKPETNGAEE
jgi:hypothetical protein